MRSACVSASTIAATAACCSIRYRKLEQLDDVARGLEKDQKFSCPTLRLLRVFLTKIVLQFSLQVVLTGF